MPTQSMEQLRRRLAELGTHIDAKVDEFHRQGALHGAEREAAAEWKLQHLKLADAARGNTKPAGELARDIEILKLTFEKWMAGLDKLRRH